MSFFSQRAQLLFLQFHLFFLFQVLTSSTGVAFSSPFSSSGFLSRPLASLGVAPNPALKMSQVERGWFCRCREKDDGGIYKSLLLMFPLFTVKMLRQAGSANLGHASVSNRDLRIPSALWELDLWYLVIISSYLDSPPLSMRKDPCLAISRSGVRGVTISYLQFFCFSISCSPLEWGYFINLKPSAFLLDCSSLTYPHILSI